MKNFFARNLRTLALCASVFVLAFIVRAWTNTWLTDFWGDSYHHWLITRLTMLHGGVYSDYKGLEVVWSPLYHYVSMLPMLLSGSSDIRVLHWMNTVFGALACALSAYLAWRLYANRVAGFAAGAVLATMTWHIAFSGMNVTEVFSGVLVLGVVLVVIREPSFVIRHSSFAALFLLSTAMPLTRTDLSLYLAILVVWLGIQKRYAEAFVIVCGVVIALGGWSAWSFYKTGNVLHWFQQYARNNLHDWVLLNEQTPNAAFAFAEYLNRLSPLALPALWGGVMSALWIPRVETSRLARNDKEEVWNDNLTRRKNLWLVTALLAGHSLFLIVGYARGIVPILTERYLAIDLPLVAVLVSGWVVVVGSLGSARDKDWVIRELGDWATLLKIRNPQFAHFFVAFVLIATTFLRFQNEIPELEIRRWGIDAEWQAGKFLHVNVQSGEMVLSDAPVAIYRSGKDVRQFVSSVALEKVGDAQTALKTKNVRWIVTQPVSYDAASNFVPRELYQAQRSGVVDGLRFELVWKYDPEKTDIQSAVWHVIQNSR